MNTVDFEIAHGKIRGARHEGVTIFKGIPYAGRVSAIDDFLGRPNCSRGQVYAMRRTWVRLLSSHPGRTSRNLLRVACS